jgi:hypothetical protein
MLRAQPHWMTGSPVVSYKRFTLKPLVLLLGAAGIFFIAPAHTKAS